MGQDGRGGGGGFHVSAYHATTSNNKHSASRALVRVQLKLKKALEALVDDPAPGHLTTTTKDRHRAVGAGSKPTTRVFAT